MAKKKAKPKSGAAATKGVSKSKAIREFMAANPKAGPSAVSAALIKDGIEVSPAFVSTVKSMAKKRKKKGRRGRPPRAAKAPAGDQFTGAELVQAKRLAEQLGGLEKAKAVIDVLAKLA